MNRSTITSKLYLKMGVPYAPDVHSVARFLHPGRKNSVVEHVLRLDYEVGLREGWVTEFTDH